ncbi:MAG: amidohydrolase family protein [Halioglobus sp.]|nr:amidohydrolase family protein [Halioglobus sp.]
MIKDTLIKNAELFGVDTLVDVRIKGDRIQQIATSLLSAPDEHYIDAAGGLLLPGLHDHHIHLLALAASLESLSCGPPDIQSEEDLAALLREKNREDERGWIRGIGYHPSVAGDIDRDWLDQHIADRPIRIQHRGGRLWILNTMALAELGLSASDTPPGMELIEGRPTGRLLEADRWLRERMNTRPPNLTIASRLLARYGITGITDTTPGNGASEWRLFGEAQANGELLQRVRMMGTPQIQHCEETAFLRRGELKIHLLESRLPDFESVARAIQDAHFNGRSVAVHCVTLTELVFALSALHDAGALRGDRIEHASVCPPEQLQEIQHLGLRVVTQPHFIEERGDQYLAEVELHDQPWLYRAAAFLAADIPLAGGSDAPFGRADPWQAMAAGVSRKTVSGKVIGQEEALTPEQALQLFLSPLERAGGEEIKLAAGSPADLCLLQTSWRLARAQLHHQLVRATWRAGQLIYMSG